MRKGTHLWRASSGSATFWEVGVSTRRIRQRLSALRFCPMNQSPWYHIRLGLLPLSISLSGIVWWIYVTESTPGGQKEWVARFLAPFPDFMSSAVIVTLVQLVLCGLACVSFFKGLDQKGKFKLFNLAGMCFSGLVGFLLLFSLM